MELLSKKSEAKMDGGLCTVESFSGSYFERVAGNCPDQFNFHRQTIGCR